MKNKFVKAINIIKDILPTLRPKNYNYFAISLATFASLMFHYSSAQVQNSALIGRFGIDGDLRTDYRQNGTFTASGSDDWFWTPGGSGKGVIDTSGAELAKAALSSGKNISFVKGTSIPRYSFTDTILYMDAIFARDYNDRDKTSFAAGSKNGFNPAIWSTSSGGQMVQDKSDIIDVYASMRRNGTRVNSTNPSPLIMAMGATVLGTNGTRYVDFELFVSKISYDSITGKFLNAGPAITGGHSDFQFNADGTLKKVGDVDISMTYSNSTVADISLYIWVSKLTYLKTYGQQKFNFVPGEFYGASLNPAYGYAKIVAKAGSVLNFWGSVNSSNIPGPSWGTASKDLGTSNNNYYSLSNAPGQFSEAAVDLTSLGIDPAFNNTSGTSCNPPYTRILIKTRSSAVFTSSLADFAGPYPFLDAPVISATIAPPQNLSCSISSIVLQPKTIDNGRYYKWTTNDGTITGKSDTAIITINKPGKYYLTAAANVGCLEDKDSVQVGLDNYKPIASASASGIINHAFTNSVQLIGGDILLSNYITPFGTSQGLLWNWKNSKGSLFASVQNPTTPDTGWYQLVVTEIRNGCSDTAFTYVPGTPLRVLPLNIIIFNASLIKSTVNMNWTIPNEQNVNHFAVERSTDGTHFTTAGIVFTNERSSKNIPFSFVDDISTMQATMLYYKLCIVDMDGRKLYSDVRVIRMGKPDDDKKVVLTYPNPVSRELMVTIPTSWQNKKVSYELFNVKGQSSVKVENANGSQTKTINVGALTSGLYIVKVTCEGETVQQKIIKY